MPLPHEIQKLPLFTQGILRVQSDSAYMRGVQYTYAGHLILTLLIQSGYTKKVEIKH